MKTDFKIQYRNLEMQVMSSLRNVINSSNYKSQHHNSKTIRINVFDYIELTLINDTLTFLDSHGLHYSIFSDCSLEDLIDILDNTQ